MKRKILLLRVLVSTLVVLLYVGSAVFFSLPETEDKNSDSVETDLTVDENNNADETKPPQEENTAQDENIMQYESEDIRDGVTPPRELYDLPIPSVTRSEETSMVSLKKTDRQPYSYFDDSLFIGDSVGVGLQNYVTEKRKSDDSFMGTARFLCIGNYSVHEAIRSPDDSKSIHRAVNGVKKPPAYFVSENDITKVFICLGLNDVALYTEDEFIDKYLILISDIRDAAPEVQIIIQSITPITLYGERKALYNAKIDSYNEALAEASAANGCFFADIAMVFKDKAGYLASQLSSDDYCHLENEAYGIWVEYLLTHAVGA